MRHREGVLGAGEKEAAWDPECRVSALGSELKGQEAGDALGADAQQHQDPEEPAFCSQHRACGSEREAFGQQPPLQETRRNTRGPAPHISEHHPHPWEEPSAGEGGSPALG